MRIKAKILWSLLGMCLLMAMVEAGSIERQQSIGLMKIKSEAEEDARVMAFVTAADQTPNHALTSQISRDMHEYLGRDVQVIDSQKRVIGAATEAGAMAGPGGDAVDQTLRDGWVRTFSGNDPARPAGGRMIVVPVRAASGIIIGAVTEEYTPIYEDFMTMANATVREAILAFLARIVIIVLFSLYIGRSIAEPLRQLTRAATGFAAGQTDLPMPPPRKDEIGDLTVAFSIMMERRKEAEERAQTMAADLMRERGRLSEILDGLPVMVFERWAGEKCREDFMSNHVKTMLGYTSQEWRSTPDFWIQRVHQEDRGRLTEDLARKFEGETGRNKEVFRWLNRDNRVIWGETHVRVIRSDDGSIGIRGFTLDVTEQKLAEEKLAESNRNLLEASRQAGMAEVATNVLHNVGNVLNSVNVSASLAADHLRQSSAPHLGRVVSLLEKNADDLGAFLAANPVGRKLPAFLGQLAGQLDAEHEAVLCELGQLGRNIEHIKDIVAVQQSYATAAGVSQKVAVVNLIEDCVRMNAGALCRHEVQLVREFEIEPVIEVDKHKVMQILINLIRNAKYACDESGRADKRLTVRVTGDEATVRIAIADNGVGIAAENMRRIFSHGFTTRETGHGFGLHSAALAAGEMRGALLVHSDGPGCGAMFTLELPV